MQPEERALSFACGGEWLYGVLSLPAQAPQAARRGVLIVVGGPQVRTGSHRQFGSSGSASGRNMRPRFVACSSDE